MRSLLRLLVVLWFVCVAPVAYAQETERWALLAESLTPPGMPKLATDRSMRPDKWSEDSDACEALLAGMPFHGPPALVEFRPGYSWNTLSFLHLPARLPRASR